MGEVLKLGCCHCKQCMKWNGGPTYRARFEEGVHVASGLEALNWFNSDKNAKAERGNCRLCGYSLFWRDKREDLATVGTLDEPAKPTNAATNAPYCSPQSSTTIR